MLIDIENAASWPPELRALFEADLHHFSDYIADHVRLDELKKSDPVAYIKNGVNRFAGKKDHLSAAAAAIAAQHDIEGFHCTRLCDDEVAAIQHNGMAIPSPELLVVRVRARVVAGDLSKADGEKLTANNLAGDTIRKGVLYFLNGPSALSYESGAYKLFRYWGGEALYGLYCQDVEMAPKLKAIGKPRIVVASLPIEKYRTVDIGRALYVEFARSKGLEIDPGSGAQGRMIEPVAADRIMRIVRNGTEEFERLTKSAGWNLPIE